MSPQSLTPPSAVPPTHPEEESFSFEEEQPDLVGVPYVAPWQSSHAMPTIPAQTQQAGQASTIPTGQSSAKKSGRKPRFSLILVATLVCVVVLLGLFVMNALAQTTPPLQTRASAMPPTTQQGAPPPKTPTGKQQKSTIKPTQAPTHGPGQNQGQAQGQGAIDWVPPQLPNGWTNAGLLTGDAIQALRTAMAFNDREMSLDYRSVGTRANHGGTFTAATFVLTPAARLRFQHNDVRVINNTLFDMVANAKLVRLVVNPHPQLVNFAQQGQQQFAWVDVAFQLWQSQIDPNHPQLRMEGKDLDPTTNQPRIHHMMVLLLRVPQQNAGNNPAMGGTGWLVSTYALDSANGTLPNILQPA